MGTLHFERKPVFLVHFVYVRKGIHHLDYLKIISYQPWPAQNVEISMSKKREVNKRRPSKKVSFIKDFLTIRILSTEVIGCRSKKEP